MANEIKASVSLDYADGSRAAKLSFGGLSFDVTGDNYTQVTMEAPITTAGAMELGDITTPGWCVIRNLDDTNFVEIRDGLSGADVIKLPANGIALFYLATSTPYVIADTAACDIEYLIIEA